MDKMKLNGLSLSFFAPLIKQNNKAMMKQANKIISQREAGISLHYYTIAYFNRRHYFRFELGFNILSLLIV